MKKITTLIFIAISFFLFTNCVIILGIHKIKHKTDQQIIKYAKKFEIPESDLFSLDTAFSVYIFKLDPQKFNAQIRSHYQPLQALYFDEKGELIKFYMNCYAGGFPSLNWNKSGKLNTFPPKDQAPIDTLLNFTKQLTYLKSIGLSSSETIKSETQDYKVFVYWNIFMRKHSKKLIKEIKKNCSLIGNGKL